MKADGELNRSENYVVKHTIDLDTDRKENRKKINLVFYVLTYRQKCDGQCKLMAYFRLDKNTS